MAEYTTSELIRSPAMSDVTEGEKLDMQSSSVASEIAADIGRILASPDNSDLLGDIRQSLANTGIKLHYTESSYYPIEPTDLDKRSFLLGVMVALKVATNHYVWKQRDDEAQAAKSVQEQS